MRICAKNSKDISIKWGVEYLILIGSALAMTACTTQRAEVVHTPANDALSQSTQTESLVKREQTRNEIEQLFSRYQSSENSNLPRGIKAILQQMVSVPADSYTSEAVRPSSSVQTASLQAKESSTKEQKATYVDTANNYPFASKRPALPLIGGFLNNPASNAPPETVEEKLNKASKSPSNQEAFSTEGPRGRLSRTPENLIPSKEKFAKLKTGTKEIISSAQGALQSANEALDRGFAALKKEGNTTEDSRTRLPTVEEFTKDAAPPEQELQDSTTHKVKKTEQKELSADISEDLQSAKQGFLARFDRSSYSLLREGVLVLALLVGFFLVSWLRMEYQHANRKN